MISISKKNIDYTYKVTKVWDTDLINITLFVSVVPSGDFYIIEHYTLQEYSESTVSDIEAELNTAEGYARILNEAKMQTQGDVETLKTQVVAINNDLILKADTTFVDTQVASKENAAEYKEYTLLTIGWITGSPARYVALDSLVYGKYNIEVQLSHSATDAQKKAWQEAEILGSITNNYLYASGTMPTINIPVYIKKTLKG